MTPPKDSDLIGEMYKAAGEVLDADYAEMASTNMQILTAHEAVGFTREEAFKMAQTPFLALVIGVQVKSAVVEVLSVLAGNDPDGE
jgi:hypothetical protein